MIADFAKGKKLRSKNPKSTAKDCFLFFKDRVMFAVFQSLICWLKVVASLNIPFIVVALMGRTDVQNTRLNSWEF